MHRQPARVLIEVAASARLLVVGSSRHHVAGGSALGPVAHDVLFNIPTTTIVVHPALVAEGSIQYS
jgi:nucleotide-binding universal stress UspA family protein